MSADLDGGSWSFMVTFMVVGEQLGPQERSDDSPHSDNPLRGTILEALQRESEMYRREIDPNSQEAKDAMILGYNDHLVFALAEFTEKKLLDNCPEIDVKTFEAQTILREGLFGRVYKAKKKDEDIIRAVKVQGKRQFRTMRPEGVPIRERKMQWALNSPFAIRLFGKYKDARNLYMIMEYADHGDLENLSHAYYLQRLPERAVREIAAQVVLGLEYLHAVNIIHRDLRLSNIVVANDGRLKICDFGLANYATNSLTALVGTTRYIAPEMFLRKCYTCAVDWWALGIIMFELLFSDHPFSDTLDEKQLAETICNPYYLVKDMKGKVSRNCEQIVQMLLERNPSRRLGSHSCGSHDVKTHPWFTGVDWYTQIYGEPPFTKEFVMMSRNRAYEAANPNIFEEGMEPEDEDPQKADFEDF